MLILTYVIMFAVAFIEMLTSYVMRAVGTMLISKKLGLSGGWKGFVPILDIYQLGKIADEDRKRYHPEKEASNWRKWVVATYLALWALTLVFYVVATVVAVVLITTFSEFEPVSSLGTVGIVALVLIGVAWLLLVAAAIAYSVILYIVYYKVFHVMADDHAVWMLILSMLFSLASPILLLVLGVSKKFPLKEPACVVCGADGTPGPIVQTSFEEKTVIEEPVQEGEIL